MRMYSAQRVWCFRGKNCRGLSGRIRIRTLFPGRCPGLRDDGPLGLLMDLASLRYKNLLRSFLREARKPKSEDFRGQ